MTSTQPRPIPFTDLDVDVVVVGAGPSGLTTAISAARHGASVLVVEKHSGLSQFPKATGVRPRVMEILRSWDLATAVLASSRPARLAMRITPMLAVPGSEMSMGLPQDDDLAPVSPCRIAVCPQDRLESVLLAHLQDEDLRLPAQVWFGHTFERFEVLPDESGVKVWLQGPTTSPVVTARFLVGADGARSTVRSRAGIDVADLGSEGDHLSMLFRADLSGSVAEPPHVLTMTVAPGLEGMLVATGEQDRWIYDVEWHPAQGERVSDWPEERVTDRLRAVTGRPDLEPEILGLFPWDFGAAFAVEQRRGPVFLVGDAAHRTTPRGATGMNTGIADGHNLGWKLAWAAQKLGGPALLDSYHQERGPVARANAEASMIGRLGTPVSSVLDHDFGVVYRSATIGTVSALAGRRAPHVWVEVAGSIRSTIDLFDGRLTVVAGELGDRWMKVAADLAESGFPVAGYRVGHELVDPEGRLEAAYGLGRYGCVLVRPDGYVVWNDSGEAADRPDELTHQVLAALGRSPVAASTQ